MLLLSFFHAKACSNDACSLPYCSEIKIALYSRKIKVSDVTMNGSRLVLVVFVIPDGDPFVMPQNIRDHTNPTLHAGTPTKTCPQNVAGKC